MKSLKIIALIFITFATTFSFAQELKMPIIESHWKSKKVAFLGDSITDKKHIGTTKNYWQFLQESLSIEPLVYGINGQRFYHIPAQLEKLEKEHGRNFDTIIIFCGTNDFTKGLKLGEWYSLEDKQTNASGKMVVRKHRTLNTDVETFRGSINIALKLIKEKFPDKQVILLTPIHRGFATFSKTNVQPDESFCNKIGLFVDAYIDAVKEASNVWAVNVIDLNAICGLYPSLPSYADCFANKERDLLHPNAKGHYRMAKALTYKLLSYPANWE